MLASIPLSVRLAFGSSSVLRGWQGACRPFEPWQEAGEASAAFAAKTAMVMVMARIEIRASESDRQHWSEKAKATGLTLSGLIRHALNETPMPRRRRRAAVDPALLRELAKIGNNLNQLARWANRDKQAVEARAVIARLIEIDREIAAIRKAHGPKPEVAKEKAGHPDSLPSDDAEPC